MWSVQGTLRAANLRRLATARIQNLGLIRTSFLHPLPAAAPSFRNAPYGVLIHECCAEPSADGREVNLWRPSRSRRRGSWPSPPGLYQPASATTLRASQQCVPSKRRVGLLVAAFVVACVLGTTRSHANTGPDCQPGRSSTKCSSEGLHLPHRSGSRPTLYLQLAPELTRFNHLADRPGTGNQPRQRELIPD